MIMKYSPEVLKFLLKAKMSGREDVGVYEKCSLISEA